MAILRTDYKTFDPNPADEFNKTNTEVNVLSATVASGRLSQQQIDANVASLTAGKTGATWEAAWAANDEPTLRAWFESNTGPRVPVDRTVPLTGIRTVASQVDADALRGHLITGAVRITAPGLEVCDFVVEWDENIGIDPIVVDLSARVSGNLHHVEVDSKRSKKSNRAVYSQDANTPDWSGWRIHHLNIHRHCDGPRVFNNARYDYIYVHDPLVWDVAVDGVFDLGVNPHCDGFQSPGANPYITRCFIDQAPPGQFIAPATPNLVSGMELHSSVRAMNAGEITFNYLNGGGHTVRIPEDTFGYPTGLVISDNKFGFGWRSGPWIAGISTTNTPVDAGFAGVTRERNTFIGTTQPVENSNGSRDRGLAVEQRIGGVAVHPDTGWRTLFHWTAGTVDYSFETIPANLAPKAGETGGIYIRRVGSRVMLQISQATLAGAFTMTLPTAFGKGNAPHPFSFSIPSSGTVTARVDAALLAFGSTAGANIPASNTGGQGAFIDWYASTGFPIVFPGRE